MHGLAEIENKQFIKTQMNLSIHPTVSNTLVNAFIKKDFFNIGQAPKKERKMFQHVRLLGVLYFAFAVSFSACGDDAWENLEDEDESNSHTDDQNLNNNEGSDTDTDNQNNVSDSSKIDNVTARIQIPDDFDCTPTTISTFFYTSTNTSGLPGGIGDTISTPEIVPGQPLEIETTQAGLDGAYYFAVVVYCEGGGSGMLPVNGVDWVGISDATVDLAPGSGSVHAGDITITVYSGIDIGTILEPDSEQNTDDMVVASVQIPTDFNCNPVSLSTLFYGSTTMSGLPSALGNSLSTSEMTAGQPFEIETTQAGLEGPFHLAVVIYCEGGGDGLLPVPNVDWLGIAPSPVTLGPDTGAVDAGDIPIKIAE
jgi:hypothetical protein